MRCQDTTAEHIIAASGDYLLTIKDNRTSLLGWGEVEALDKTRPNMVIKCGHSRRVIPLHQGPAAGSGDTNFPHTRQLVQVSRTRTVYPAAGVRQQAVEVRRGILPAVFP